MDETATTTLIHYDKLNLITGVERQYNASGTLESYIHKEYSIPFITYIIIVIVSLIILNWIILGHTKRKIQIKR